MAEQGNNPVPPASDALVWFWDDDFLRDGQDVPMPDTSELANAMAEAYVHILFDLPAQSDVPFLANVPFTRDAVVGAQRWDSVRFNSEAYWVAYVLGAFQGDRDYDADPRTELLLTYCGQVPYDEQFPDEHLGGVLVYLESAREVAISHGIDPQREEAATVVHEVGHLFRSMHEPVTLRDDDWDGPIAYTEEYLAIIRSVDKPASR